MNQRDANDAAGPPPDQRERELISRELDVCMLVEAAAGTGKTTKMIDRMVALLAAGKCEIDKLAAVTFTRQAAAELRSRFQVELEQRARTAGEQAGPRLADAATHIERCFIGTIHSFCARLLRERPVEAGVGLLFQEADETADQRMRLEAWREYVSRLYAQDDPLLNELRELGLDVAQLQAAFGIFADYPDVDEWPAPPVELPDLVPAVTGLEQFVRHIEELQKELPTDPENDDRLMKRYEQVTRLYRQNDLENPAELMETVEVFQPLEWEQLRKWRWPGSKAQAEEELERWNTFSERVAAPLLEAWRARRYHVAMRVIQPCQQVYDAVRRDAGQLNFQDLLLRAAELLRDKPHVREYFRRRFTHLLVDEFQDTDPIQAEVMLLLTAEDATEREWRNCRPARGSLFVVGDPKQSIYRFRRADIATYNEVRQIIEKCGRVVTLSANFRTIAPVREWVNRFFEGIFPTAATQFQPASVPLGGGRRGENAGDLVGVRVIEASGDLRTQDAIAEHEADLIARTIRRSIDAGLTVPRTDKELAAGVSPQAAPGDFLIITRNRARLNVYAKKLGELGIAHEVSGSSALNQVPELSLLHLFLSAVVQPDNPVALVAVLRSELFGVSDQTLYAYKCSGGQFSFHATMPHGLSAAYRAELADAFEQLRQAALLVARLPALAAIERIVTDLGLAARAAAAPGGDVQAGSLAKALELLRAAQAEHGSAAELVEYLDRLTKEEGERYDGMPARPHEAPAVRVMNLHKAKGLEAPVVFLADPSGDADHDVRLCIDRTARRVVGHLAVLERSGNTSRVLARPAKWHEVTAREKQFQDAEDSRLLYVAATRAGTQLTISQRQQYKSQNPWRFFETHLGDCPRLDDPGPQRPPVTPAACMTEQAVADALAAIRSRWDVVTAPTYRTAAAKAISLTPGRFTGSSEHGTEWGTVIHLLLEAAMTDPSAALEGLAGSALAEEGLDPALAEEAVAVVRAVTQSPIWRRAQASQRRLIEVPIQTLVTLDVSAAGLPTVLRGVIDLVFLEPAGWVIVDYKTDDRSGQPLDDLVAHYSPQIRLYADAWRQASGQAVRELGLYFTHSGEYRTVGSD
jgi:ATP-dependent helicase/nuclease subunit A